MQIVALDWDRDSARVAVALRRPNEPALVRAASIPLDGETKALASRVREALPEVRWAKARVLVAVGGDRVAFRLLKLPPTPDAELPEMVRLVAEREFGAGDGVVDYVPLSGDAETPRSVLAVRVRQPTLDAINQLIEELGGEVSRIVLRACGAASVAARLDDSVNQGACLVEAPAGEVTDLIVLDEGLPAIIRTARGEVVSTGGKTPGDVRRTLSSASLQLGRSVNRVVTLSTEGLSLADAAVEKWRLPSSDADSLGTLAGAVGAALDEADQIKPVVDLLDPRKPPSNNLSKKRQLAIAGLAATLLLLIAGSAYWSLLSLDKQTAKNKEDLKAIQKSIEKRDPFLKQSQSLDQWSTSDVNWLEKLERLSHWMRPQPLKAKDFPANDDVMLRQMVATASTSRQGRGGEISLDAVARDAEVSTILEDRLGEERRRVEQGPLDQLAEGRYRWRFKPKVKVEPDTSLLEVSP